MAVIKTILKNTNLETIIKIGGTAGSSTITLDVDCLATTTQALTADTRLANIVSMASTGVDGSNVTVTRNAIPVFACTGWAGVHQFNENGFVDTQENDGDLVVTISGGEAHLYITLRKVQGYATKIETATYSIYDDETVVGG